MSSRKKHAAAHRKPARMRLQAGQKSAPATAAKPLPPHPVLTGLPAAREPRTARQNRKSRPHSFEGDTVAE